MKCLPVAFKELESNQIIVFPDVEALQDYRRGRATAPTSDSLDLLAIVTSCCGMGRDATRHWPLDPAGHEDVLLTIEWIGRGAVDATSVEAGDDEPGLILSDRPGGSPDERAAALAVLAVAAEFGKSGFGTSCPAVAALRRLIALGRHDDLQTQAARMNKAFRDIRLGMISRHENYRAENVALSDFPLEERFCPFPFTDFEITPTGDCFICCPSYLPVPIGNVKNFEAATILNSKAAQEIRRSILDGDFAYCDRFKCKLIKQKLLQRRDDPQSAWEKRVIDERMIVVDRAQNLRFSFDPTCNLSCPQCRGATIVAKGAEREWIMHTAEKVALPLMREANRTMLNGYGDIFTSRACRMMLAEINPRDFPNLQLDLITNGVLFTEAQWNSFPGIHGMVRQVRISVDAAREETYLKIRRGGDFAKLSENLEFIKGLRIAGIVKELVISFVVQKDNFEEMPEFIRWGERLGCDWIVFESLMDWNTWGPEGFRERAVHLPGHPDHARFREVIRDPAFLPRYVAHDFGRLVDPDPSL